MFTNTDNDVQNHNGKRLLTMLQKEYPGYHPLIALVKLAHTTEEDRVEMSCHATIAKFIEPEIKSIEIKASVRSDFGTLRIVESKEEIHETGNETKAIDNKLSIAEISRTAPQFMADVINGEVVDSLLESNTEEA